MAEPFLAETRIMSFNFSPRGWAMCNGQLLPINQNQGLFSLLGTSFGGDGRVNFGLPDFRGRTPIHMGNSHTLGEKAGVQSHTLSITELPIHNHVLNNSTAAVSTNIPASGGSLGNSAPNLLYNSSNNNMIPMSTSSVVSTGGSQAHTNMQPFLVLNFCIPLQGIFPSQN